MPKPKKGWEHPAWEEIREEEREDSPKFRMIQARADVSMYDGRRYIWLLGRLTKKYNGDKNAAYEEMVRRGYYEERAPEERYMEPSLEETIEEGKCHHQIEQVEERGGYKNSKFSDEKFKNGYIFLYKDIALIDLENYEPGDDVRVEFYNTEGEITRSSLLTLNEIDLLLYSDNTANYTRDSHELPPLPDSLEILKEHLSFPDRLVPIKKPLAEKIRNIKFKKTNFDVSEYQRGLIFLYRGLYLISLTNFWSSGKLEMEYIYDRGEKHKPYRDNKTVYRDSPKLNKKRAAYKKTTPREEVPDTDTSRYKRLYQEIDPKEIDKTIDGESWPYIKDL